MRNADSDFVLVFALISLNLNTHFITFGADLHTRIKYDFYSGVFIISFGLRVNKINLLLNY